MLKENKNMIKYVVVKAFDVLEKGDVFVSNDDKTFTCEHVVTANGYRYSSTITVNKQYINEAVANGNMEQRKDTLTTDTTDYKELCKKYKKSWNSLYEYLDRKAAAYQEDIDYTTVRWQSGDIQECQKVQDITVLANLKKEVETIKLKMQE